MAQLLQCPNGHYYDPDMYSSCPYCTGESIGVDRSFTAPIPHNIPGTAPQNIMATVPLAASGDTIPPEPAADPTMVDGIPITMPVYMGGKVSEDGPKPEFEDDSKFVVGWLVAIEGPYRGKSFEIHNGYTYIGRTEGDIVLALDQQVSSSKNVSTVYDSKNNRFFVRAGDSRNLVYVNGKALIAGDNLPIDAYGSVEIGGTKLLFVPFCSDQFSWNKRD